VSRQISRDDAIEAFGALLAELVELSHLSAFQATQGIPRLQTIKDRVSALHPRLPLSPCPSYGQVSGLTGVPSFDFKAEVKHYQSVTERILVMLKDPNLCDEGGELKLVKDEKGKLVSRDTKRVFVIHGRNSLLVEEFRMWLRTLGLDPITFDEVRNNMDRRLRHNH
jgi:hypothetical protein